MHSSFKQPFSCSSLDLHVLGASTAFGLTSGNFDFISLQLFLLFPPYAPPQHTTHQRLTSGVPGVSPLPSSLPRHFLFPPSSTPPQHTTAFDLMVSSGFALVFLKNLLLLSIICISPTRTRLRFISRYRLCHHLSHDVSRILFSSFIICTSSIRDRLRGILWYKLCPHLSHNVSHILSIVSFCISHAKACGFRLSILNTFASNNNISNHNLAIHELKLTTLARQTTTCTLNRLDLTKPPQYNKGFRAVTPHRTDGFRAITPQHAKRITGHHS